MPDQFQNLPLPPLQPLQLKLLCASLRHLPAHWLQDAVQEAWLVHLEGLDPVVGLAQWRRRELGDNPGMTGMARQWRRPKTEPLKPHHQGGQVRRQF